MNQYNYSFETRALDEHWTEFHVVIQRPATRNISVKGEAARRRIVQFAFAVASGVCHAHGLVEVRDLIREVALKLGVFQIMEEPDDA